MGLAEVVSSAYPDPTQFDVKSQYYDPKSTKENPRWVQVDVKVNKIIDRVSLDDLRAIPACADMLVLRKGNRLSITPVTEKQYKAIVNFVKKKNEN